MHLAWRDNVNDGAPKSLGVRYHDDSQWFPAA
jgi:hypothetical protein